MTDTPRWHYPQPTSKGWWVSASGQCNRFLFLGDADVPDDWYFGPLPAVPKKLPDEQRPAWHDKPTVLGLWLARLKDGDFDAYMLDEPMMPMAEVGDDYERWYGPIPEDTQ